MENSVFLERRNHTHHWHPWISSGARALFNVSVCLCLNSLPQKENAVTTEFPLFLCGCVLHSPGLPTFNTWIRGTQRLKTRGGSHPKALPWKCGNDLGVCKAVSNRQAHNIFSNNHFNPWKVSCSDVQVARRILFLLLTHLARPCFGHIFACILVGCEFWT